MFRRLLLALVLCCTAAGWGAPSPAAEAQPVYIPAGAPLPEALGLSLLSEVETNNTSATATHLPSNGLTARGNIFPVGDVDYYSFSALAGDRVHVAVITAFGAGSFRDSLLEVIGTDGVTVLETDNDDGTLGGTSSVVAGFPVPTTGTYYLRVTEAANDQTLRPYHLHFRRVSGLPQVEVESNDVVGNAQALPSAAWVAGSVSLTTDFDFYTVTVYSGQTIYASLDLNPTRGGTEWNGRLGLGLFNSNILVVNDAGTSGTPDAEAMVLSVLDSGVYYITVDSNGLAGGDYHLSVAVVGAASEGVNCTTYNSTAVPVGIPTGPGVITSTLTIPDAFVIADLDVSLTLTHTFMADLDAVLVSPAGNRNALFTDIGSSVSGQNTNMQIRLDDEAAIPSTFTVVSGLVIQPESDYRLHWFDGEQAAGQWALVLYDDGTGDGGSLQGWSLTACAAPPPPACPAGSVATVVYQADFEGSDGGFAHAGTGDEWELGLPTDAPLGGCNSGSSCWATDLDDTYDASSDQDLFAPSVSLVGYTSAAWVTWAQQYQMESASFDQAWVDAYDGISLTQRLWEWRDSTMTVSVGNPSSTVAESAGWGLHTADLSDFLGGVVELRFHLDSDTTIQMAGLAIDDMTIMACQPTDVYLPLVLR